MLFVEDTEVEVRAVAEAGAPDAADDLARLDRLVYGCDDPKTGACKSLYNIVQDGRLNHRLEVTSGVLAYECSQLLQEFFERRRTKDSKSKIDN